MKTLIHLLCISAIALNPVFGTAKADAVDEAKAYVAKSKETAKEVAETLFKRHLFELNNEFIEYVSTAQPAMKHTESMSMTLIKLEEQLSKIENLSMTDDQQFRQEFHRISLEAYEAYTNARTQEELRDRLFLEGQAAAETLERGIEHSVRLLEQRCKTGVGTSVLEDLTLTPKLVAPHIYDFNISVKIGDNGVTDPKFVGSSGRSKDMTTAIAAINTLANAIGTATGHVYVGAAVGAAVSVIVYFIDQETAKAQATIAADANFIVFSQRATADDVQKYYREICARTVPFIRESLVAARDIENSKAVKARLDAATKKITPFLNEIARLQAALNAKADAIEKSIDPSLNPQQRLIELQKQLLPSAEYKAMMGYLKELPADYLNDVIYVTMTSLVLSLQSFAESMNIQKDQVFKRVANSLKPSVLKLIKLARRLSQERLDPDALTLMERELHLNRVVAEAYHDFDLLVAQYIREYFTSGAAPSARINLLNVWVPRLQALITQYPHSLSLAKLDRDTQVLISTLGLEAK